MPLGHTVGHRTGEFSGAPGVYAVGLAPPVHCLCNSFPPETSSAVVFEVREPPKQEERKNTIGEEEEKEGVEQEEGEKRRQWGQEEGPPVIALLQERRLQTGTYAVQLGGGETKGNETQLVFSRPGTVVDPGGTYSGPDMATPKPTIIQPPSLDEDNMPTPVVGAPPPLQDATGESTQDSATPTPGVSIAAGRASGNGRQDGRQDGLTPKRPSLSTVVIRKPSPPQTDAPTRVAKQDRENRVGSEEVKEEEEDKPLETGGVEAEREEVVAAQDGGGSVEEGACVPKVESSGSWVIVGGVRMKEGKGEEERGKEADSAAAGKVDLEGEVGAEREPPQHSAKRAWPGAEQPLAPGAGEELEPPRGKTEEEKEMLVEDIEVQASNSQVSIPGPKSPRFIPSTSLDPIPIPAEYLPATSETPSKPNCSLQEEEFFTPTGHVLLPMVS